MPVLIRILFDLGLFRSEVGVVALTCALVDDVSAWSLLALVVALVTATSLSSVFVTLALTALSMLLECETVFELGPDTGGAKGLLAHNLPNARIFLLDDGAEPPAQTKPGPTDRLYHLPRGDYGRRLDATAQGGLVTHLPGDSFTFDLLPYSGTADLVYIEGSRRYSHIASDTEAAFGLLSELGTIVWDGYSGDAGVYSYLNDLAPSLDRPVFHILGTRLALYSRWDIAIEAE